jgi:hypothetical protein
LSSLLVIGDGDFWRRDSFFHTSLCLYAWFWDANADAAVGERRISGRKPEGRKSLCADQCHQSCKNLAGCSKKPKKSWRIFASSSATVAAEVHSFLFLVYSEILSVSLSLHLLPLGGAKYLVILGWVVGRVQGIIMGMGRRCSLKRERQLRAFLMMILEWDLWDLCMGHDAPWREIWQIYALVDHPWRVRFERDLCIGDDPLQREIWVRFVHLSIDIMMSSWGLQWI